MTIHPDVERLIEAVEKSLDHCVAQGITRDNITALIAALRAERSCHSATIANLEERDEHIACLNVSLDRAEAKVKRLAEALEEIARLPEAYSTNIFPEPDFEKAHKLLVAGGMTLDAISASSGRHFTGIAADIAKRALTAPAATTSGEGGETP